MNYAYVVLDGECRRAINVVGLEPSVGFLHDFGNYQTKQSLVYDLQQPFRWLSDISVIEGFESEALKLSAFYFTGDDYRYRLEPEVLQRFIDLIRVLFNSGVGYKGRVLKWDTVIQEKTSELAGYLNGRLPKIDFSQPNPVVERTDHRVIRDAILGLTQAEARRRGIGTSSQSSTEHEMQCARTIRSHAQLVST